MVHTTTFRERGPQRSASLQKAADTPLLSYRGGSAEWLKTLPREAILWGGTLSWVGGHQRSDPGQLPRTSKSEVKRGRPCALILYTNFFRSPGLGTTRRTSHVGGCRPVRCSVRSTRLLSVCGHHASRTSWASAHGQLAWLRSHTLTPTRARRAFCASSDI